MAWNNGFPAAYQPLGFQNPYQSVYQPQMPQQPTQAVQVNSRMVEIIPVDSEEAAATWPVGTGSTQALMAKDDSFIAFKTVFVNGQSEFSVYVKRPPAPPEPAFNPHEFVRRDEVETLIATALTAQRKKGKDAEE